MKTIHFLFILMMTIFSIPAFTQSFETDELDPEMDEQMLAAHDEESELAPPVSDEIERQEDVLYPEGEDSSWSLGSEDLPAEEYE